jgi:phenylalanyl-tRNA synthetase beta chain
MLITLNWLKDFIDIREDPHHLAETLTNAGLEVEAVYPVVAELKNIVVAKILKIREHPNASRLVLCDVTDGNTEYKIVCGAKNMKQGDIVALAKQGAVLPKTAKFAEGIKVEKTKIRGQLSEGMLCAENELGIGEDSEGILILNDENPDLGSTLTESLGLDDFVFELAITPNRPDCLSVIGVARQLSAVLNRKLKYPDNKYEVFNIDNRPGLSVACGVRSINNVVDITNYVMLEYGHPLHVFDAEYIEGLNIVVRTASAGETINTLDETQRKLTPEDLLICDSNKPVAIAGVMGGENSEVSEKTTAVVLECAYFDPITVRKTSKRLKLSTESSYRFERGLDPNSIGRVIDRTSYLLSKLASGRVNEKIADVYPRVFAPRSVSLNTKNLNSLVGVNLRKSRVVKILNSLDISVESTSRNILECKVPTYRVDITREIDLIEDIAIIHGYNSVPITLPQVCVINDINTKTNYSSVKEIKKFLCSAGFCEVINYSFSDPQVLGMFSQKPTIKLLNPLTTEQSAMRTAIIPSVLENLKRNLNNQIEDIKLFEISQTYYQSQNGIEERQKLSLAASVGLENELWDKRKYDFFDLKNLLINLIKFLKLQEFIDTEDKCSDISFVHPGKSASILLDKLQVGYIGYLHPDFLSKLDINTDVVVMELDLTSILTLQKGRVSKFTTIPKYPYTKRDLSLIVDSSISVGRIIREIEQTENDLIEDVRIFDVYSEGELARSGEKSVSVSLIIRSKEKTLTDDEANLVQSSTFDKLSESLNARMRT